MNPFKLSFDTLEDYQKLYQSAPSPAKLSRLIQCSPEFFTLNEVSYSDSQDHSELIDKLFGFQILAVESNIKEHYQQGPEEWENCEIWNELNPRQLQTPYDEIIAILKDCRFKEGQTLVDLGAGYGRAGIIAGELYPESYFIGVEVVAERAREGNRIFNLFGHDNSFIQTQGLHKDDFELPPGEIYFLYDFGKIEQIEAICRRLASVAFKESFLLVARGRGVRGLIDYKFPQLRSVYAPKHALTYSIYSTYCELRESEQ